MKRKWIHIVGPAIGLVFFAFAIIVLDHELKHYHYHEIVTHLKEIPTSHLLLALALTVLGYAVLTGYDFLSVHYIRRPLAYHRIALASFLGYSMSHNIGFAMFSGAPIRYRLYSAWGLSAVDVTKIIAMNGLTFWVGFLTLGTLAFLLEPLVIPPSLHFPLATARPLGWVFLAIITVYLLLTITKKKPLTVRDWEFTLPSLRIAVSQMAVSSLDWALACGVLYTLLPHHPTEVLSYPAVVGVFLLAQIAGLASQVPGGLGVFETVVIVLLSPVFPSSAILGALLAYRGIYYLLPLSVASVLLATNEIFRKKEDVRRVALAFGTWTSAVVPYVLAFTTFIGGAILLFSGATPAVGTRLAWLKDLLPLPVVEISHFLGSLIGAGLLFLAWGLQRRLDVAYHLTLVLLGAGSVFSLLKGFDYEEALILAVMGGLLFPCRRHFYRTASFFSQRFSTAWVVAIILVLVCSVWLGMFSYKHVEYSHELWWQFTFSGNAPRFLRAMVGVIGVAFLFALGRLLAPGQLIASLPNVQELSAVRAVVQQSRRTYANLALLGDKLFFLDDEKRAFIMYGVEGRCWIALGDPIGPEETWGELIWQFREMCDRSGGWTVFYEVRPQTLHLYLDLGLSLLKIGEEACVSLERFSLEGGQRKGLRYMYHRLEREGCIFEVIPSSGVSSLLSEFKMISDAWLSEKRTKEKGFSLGFFSEDYLGEFPAGIVRKEGRIVAFANIWAGAGKEELSMDLMRHLPEAPASVMEYLFVNLMLWGKREGYQRFNLGMAPLAGLEDRALAPLWSKLGAFLFRHGEYFYNFQGLRAYKERFDPEWEPRYLASPGGLALPRILSSIAALISGGLKGVISK